MIIDSTKYRDGVGIMLINDDRKILVAQRLENNFPGWQMPQGGVEHGEILELAARRELLEEIGTDNVAYLAETDEWLYYDLPAEIAARIWQGRYKGQRQRWFAYKFLGSDNEINVHTAQPEFKDWRWVAPDELANCVVSFKRELYQRIIEDLYNKLF